MTVAQNNITTLFNDLSKETQDRINADTEITNKLTDEMNARVAGDNSINNQLIVIRTQIQEEITARNEADQNLINALQNETLARSTADETLRTQISQVEQASNKNLQQEIEDRKDADDILQDQIDDIKTSANFSTAEGIGTRVSATRTKTIYAKIGGGLRFDGLERIAVDTGAGIAVIDGKIVPKLADGFFINEKGEIDMQCCAENPEAGVGLEYTVNPETGKTAVNVVPPRDGQIGGVKQGQNITIHPDGTIDATGSGDTPYTLPPASTTTLGGVIVGDNLTVNENGEVSAPEPYSLPIASPTTLGGVRIGQNLSIDQNGVLNAQVPDISTVGNGDTVLAGDGIDVTKDSENNTATVGLNASTKATLAQVGDIKNQVDAQSTEINGLKTSKVDTTTYTADKASTAQAIAEAKDDAQSAQTQAAQANAAVEDVMVVASEAKTTAESAISTATTANQNAATALSNASAANTAAVNANANATSAVTTATEAKSTADNAIPKDNGTGENLSVGGTLTIIHRPAADGVLNAEIKNVQSGLSIDRTLKVNSIRPFSSSTGGVDISSIGLILNKAASQKARVISFAYNLGNNIEITPHDEDFTTETNKIRIASVASPVNNNDAANKEYVDSLATYKPVAFNSAIGYSVTNVTGGIIYLPNSIFYNMSFSLTVNDYDLLGYLDTNSITVISEQTNNYVAWNVSPENGGQATTYNEMLVKSTNSHVRFKIPKLTSNGTYRVTLIGQGNR